MPNPDDDDENVVNLDDVKRVFEDRVPPDKSQEYVVFLDEAIGLLKFPDMFSGAGIDPGANAWFQLQSATSKNMLAEIQEWIDNNSVHAALGEIIHRHNQVFELIKKRFNNADALMRFPTSF